MVIAFPGSKKRREILAAPELLRVVPEGMKISKFTTYLVRSVLTLFFAVFMLGTVKRMIFDLAHGKHQLFVPISAILLFSCLYAFAMFLICRKKEFPLVFTEAGITGSYIFNARYDELGTYRWETSSGFLSTGQASKEAKRTLLFTANKGLFPEMAYTTRYGTSILGSYGFYFDEEKARCAEEILSKFGITKVADKQ